MSMKVHGQMIKQMDEVFIDIKMERLMMAIGKTIYSTEWELKDGLMGLFIRDSISKAKSMGMDFTNGMMDHNTRVSGMRTKSQAWEFIPGLMVGHSRESGKTTIWKAMDDTPGEMVVCLMESTEKTKSMVMEFTNGLTGESIKEIGRLESNMDLESIL